MLTAVVVVAEIAVLHSYPGHDARSRWLLHFSVGAIVVVLVGAGHVWWTRRPIRQPLFWVFAAHVVSMFPDFLLQAGIPHSRWMDVFLGHISAELVPGRESTLFFIMLAALVGYLFLLDRVPLRVGPLPLHNVSRGGGASVVVVHGLGASGRYWDRVIDELDGLRTTAIDLLGFGRSPKPRTASYDVDCHADALAPHVPVGSIVVAHSTGAIIALRLAVRQPDRVAGLVLVAPPAYPDAESARRRIGELGTLARLTGEGHPVAGVLCTAMCLLRPLAAVSAAAIARNVPARIAADGALHTWPSYSRTLQRVVIEHRIHADLEAVDVPIQILVGDHDDIATATDIGTTLERTGIDRSAFQIVHGDHHLPLSRPRLVAELVQRVHGEVRHRAAR